MFKVFIVSMTSKKNCHRARQLFLWHCSVVDFFISTDGSCSRFLGEAAEVRRNPVRRGGYRGSKEVSVLVAVS